MDLQPISSTSTNVSTTNAVQSNTAETPQESVSTPARQEQPAPTPPTNESQTDTGALVLMQSTRTVTMTHLRLVLASSGSSDSTANNEDLRAELKQGLEDLIQDNQGSLQDLLKSDLLSDQQIVSVQYFSMTMVQTKTLVMQQVQVPTVDDVSQRLQTQFDALMDKLQATLDKLVPGAGNQTQETAPITTDTETADRQTVPSEEDVSTTPQTATATTPDEVEPSATEQTTQADTQEEMPKTTDTRETKTLSLFSLTQSFSLTFKQSMAKFHSRMNHFHMHKGRHHDGAHQRSALVARFYQMQTETSVYQSTASGDDSSTLVA